MVSYVAERSGMGIKVGGSFFNLNKYELKDMLKKLEEEKKTLPERIGKVNAALNLIKEEERGASEKVHNLAYEMYVNDLDDDCLLSKENFHEHWNYNAYVSYAKIAIKNL